MNSRRNRKTSIRLMEAGIKTFQGIIGAYVANHRRGRSQDEVARNAGCSAGVVSALETASRFISPANAQDIFQAVGLGRGRSERLATLYAALKKFDDFGYD